MTRTAIVCLIAVFAAAALGARLGGRTGVGIVAGALLGGAIGLAAHGLLARSLTRDFEASLRALLGAFGLKLAVLAGAWAALTFVPALAAVAAPTGFLLAFAATAALLLAVGSLDHLRALASATTAPPASVIETGDLLP